MHFSDSSSLKTLRIAKNYFILVNLSSVAGALSLISMASKNQKHKRRLGDSMFLGTPKRSTKQLSYVR